MTPEQFCYWLQGRAELMPNDPPSADEWKMIGEHLETVFKKVTPKLADDAERKASLQQRAAQRQYEQDAATRAWRGLSGLPDGYSSGALSSLASGGFLYC